VLVAKSDGQQPAKRVKRRVRPVETVRQQRDKQQTDVKTKPRRIRKVLHWLGTPFRTIAAWSFWQSKAWKPARVVGKILSRVLLISYFRSSVTELKQVTWPNWKLSWRLTWAVLVFSVFFGVIVAIVDFGLDKLFKQLILN
jgi:preprotein translocase SecE subunit